MKTLDLIRKYLQTTTEPERMDDWQAILWQASGLIKIAKHIRGTDRRSRKPTMIGPFIQEELFK